MDDGMHLINYYEDSVFGKFLVEADTERDIHYLNKNPEFLSLILELQQSKKTTLVVSSVSFIRFSSYFSRDAYQVVTYQELIASYPKTLEQRLNRSIKILCSLAGGYGKEVC